MEVFRAPAGSHLFGTATAASDHDFRALALPTPDEVLLGKAYFSREISTGNKDSKNSATDIDVNVVSVSHFVDKLTKMEVGSIELLFSPSVPDIMDDRLNVLSSLRAARFKLLSRNMKAFTGYGKSQAMRYAVRGDRKNSIEELLQRLSEAPPGGRLHESGIVESLHANSITGVEIVNKLQPGGVMLDFISAFGLEVAVTCKVSEAIRIYQRPLAELGHRTELAARNGGADWKGLYHAQRIVDEGIELFSTGKLRFPCAHAHTYLAIRNGELTLDGVLDVFEEKLAFLTDMEPIPEFRDSPDMVWADQFVANIHREVVISGAGA